MTNESVWNHVPFEMAEYEKEMEEALKVENWMTNGEIWNSNFNFVETTEALELEGWMTDDKIWDTNSINESELALEDWMINADLWK